LFSQELVKKRKRKRKTKLEIHLDIKMLDTIEKLKSKAFHDSSNIELVSNCSNKSQKENREESLAIRQDAYENNFDSKKFLNTFHCFDAALESPSRCTYLNMHEIFNMDILKGEWLLDIGSGPSMWAAFFQSRKFNNIIMSEYASANRAELIKWLNNHSDAYDWHKQTKFISKLENIGENELIKRTREAIKAVIPVDVNKLGLGLIESYWFPKFDCVTSSFCLEVVASNPDSLRDVTIKSIKGLLKPNGFLILQGILKESSYSVGEQQFQHYPYEMDEIISAIEANSFRIIFKKQIEDVQSSTSDSIISDGQNIYVIVAQLKF
jgi:SAM-dependent methyltransferase